MTTVQTGHEFRDTHIGRLTQLAAGGSIGEAICGIAVVVLAIIGLSNHDWTALASIGTIVAGAALIMAASAGMRAAATNGSTEVEGAMSAEVLGGAAGIVLGILAIVGIMPNLLNTVALIVFGGALILGCLTTSRAPASGPELGRYMPTHAAMAAAGSQALIGLAVGILGIVGLVGNPDHAVTIDLVGLLVVGAGVLITGSAVSARLVSVLRESTGP